jgi:hypothetical protein
MKRFGVIPRHHKSCRPVWYRPTGIAVSGVGGKKFDEAPPVMGTGDRRWQTKRQSQDVIVTLIRKAKEAPFDAEKDKPEKETDHEKDQLKKEER